MKDHYKTLGVTKRATIEEIKKAYRKLALRYHPDRHPGVNEQDRKKKTEKMMEINDAYNTLKDDEKRMEYDKTTQTHANKFTKKPAQTCNNFYNNFYTASFFSESFFTTKNNIFTPKKIEPAVYVMQVTLDELYTGAKKFITVKRNINGIPENKDVCVEIKPGYKSGTKFTFENAGEVYGNVTQDVVIVIEEAVHPYLKRDGNDIFVKIFVSLDDVKNGFHRVISLPGKRSLTVKHSDFNFIGEETVFPGRGMPIAKDPLQNGNLRIICVMRMPVK